MKIFLKNLLSFHSPFKRIKIQKLYNIFIFLSYFYKKYNTFIKKIVNICSTFIPTTIYYLFIYFENHNKIYLN